METPNKLNSLDNLQTIKKSWVTPIVEIISVESGISSGVEASGGSNVS